MPETEAGDRLHEAFEHYDRRFAEAVARMPSHRPWEDEGRDAILCTLRKCLGIQDRWIPFIQTSTTGTAEYQGYLVECLQSTSWQNCRGAAHLYVPHPAPEGKASVVLVACGHGEGGKLAYRALGEQLARNGLFALIPDNIGQGERTKMGHRRAPGVFAANLSVQGLIVMESMGWLNWIHLQKQFDPSRIAVVGNSGGGTLAHFLGTLCGKHLAAVSSSGYPGSYAFIHRKEKELCHCNLLPGIVGALEMWHVYGCIAPVPLFLFQGRDDPLFPQELFWQNARKVHYAYEKQGSAKRFKAEVFAGGHSWDQTRRLALTRWLCETLKQPFREEATAELSPERLPPACFESWPDDAQTLEGLAVHLSGMETDVSRLSDVFTPAVEVPRDDHALGRGDAAEILAQFEAALVK